MMCFPKKILFFILFFPSICLANHDLKSSTHQNIVPVGQWKFGLTFGYGQLKQPVNKQKDISLFILPDIRYYGEKFSIENLNVSYALYEEPSFLIELVGKQNYDGIYFPGEHRDAFSAFAASGTFNRKPILDEKTLNTAIESEVVLPKHKSMSYLAGAELRLYGEVDFFFSALQDITNVHNGYELNVNMHYQYNMGNFHSNFEAGIIHKSRKMSDYYFGVNYAQYEQNNTRLTSTNNIYAQYTLAYPIKEHWYALAVIKQQWLDNQIKQSSVIERGNILSYFIGIKYIY